MTIDIITSPSSDGVERSGQKVWFITGCATGLGKRIAIEALTRGDRVISTARGDLSRLDDVKDAGAHVMECDITIPFSEMKEVAKVAENVYGRVDVLVNNAGYGKLGTLEELGPDGLLEQYKINVFGVANVTSAFLPYFRQRRSGTVIVAGSRSGIRVMPMLGAYGTSKAAVNAYGETLAKEVAPFGIRVLTIIPGGYFTEGTTGNPIPPTETFTFDDYKPLHDKITDYLKTFPNSQLGDPNKYAELVVDVVRGEGQMRTVEGGLRPWPERLVVGSDAVAEIRRTFANWEKTLEEYGDLARSTDTREFVPPEM